MDIFAMVKYLLRTVLMCPELDGLRIIINPILIYELLRRTLGLRRKLVVSVKNPTRDMS